MSDAVLRLGDTEVVDTFAEAFPMYGTRFIVTAHDRRWATEAARSVTGFATSVIGCKCEAAIERDLEPDETPDGRPGASILLFAMDRESLGKRLVERVGVGASLRYFGDGFQASKVIGGQRFWRVPVMDGEFLVTDDVGAQKGVAGGNLIIMASHQPSMSSYILGSNATAVVRQATCSVLVVRE